MAQPRVRVRYRYRNAGGVIYALPPVREELPDDAEEHPLLNPDYHDVDC